MWQKKAHVQGQMNPQFQSSEVHVLMKEENIGRECLSCMIFIWKIKQKSNKVIIAEITVKIAEMAINCILIERIRRDLRVLRKKGIKKLHGN